MLSEIIFLVFYSKSHKKDSKIPVQVVYLIWTFLQMNSKNLKIIENLYRTLKI